jgi:hypothetical protein
VRHVIGMRMWCVFRGIHQISFESACGFGVEQIDLGRVTHPPLQDSQQMRSAWTAQLSLHLSFKADRRKYGLGPSGDCAP